MVSFPQVSLSGTLQDTNYAVTILYSRRYNPVIWYTATFNTVITYIARYKSYFFYVLSSSHPLTTSMEQSFFREVNGVSARQDFSRILWNSKIYYRIHKSPPSVLVLSQISPVHAPPSHFLKIYMYTKLPSMPGSSKLFFLQFSPSERCIRLFCPRACYILYPPTSSWFVHPNNIWWGVAIDNEALRYVVFSTHLVPRPT